MLSFKWESFDSRSDGSEKRAVRFEVRFQT